MTRGHTLPPTSSTGDAELDALFGNDPELLATARRLKAAAPEPVLDGQFRSRLRAQLVDEAKRQLSPSRRHWWHRRGGTLPAFGLLGGGLALVAASLVLILGSPSAEPLHAPAATAAIANNPSIDPAEAITVSFNQPMDKTAVVAGLHLQPAAAVTTNWQGNTLVVTPLHPLAANTAYTVTIDQAAVRSVNGTTATAAVRFSFGTAPTPTPSPIPAPAAPPTLVPTPLAGLGSPVVLGFDQHGSVIVSGHLDTTTSPGDSATPDISPPSSATPSATQSAVVANGTYRLAANATPQRIGDAAGAVAHSPDGAHLALATVAEAGSGSSISIANPDGSNPKHLAGTTDTAIALTWTSSTTIEVITAQRIESFDTNGSHSDVLTATAGEHFTGIGAAGGRFVVSEASDHSRVTDLFSKTSWVLPDAAAVVWSADGTTLAWRNASNSRIVDIADLDQLSRPAGLTLPDNAGSIGALAIDHTGTEVAVVDDSTRLWLLGTSSGAVLATFPGPVASAGFAPDADQIVLVDRVGNVSTSAIPAPPAAPANVPAEALTLANSFVAGQIRGDSTTLQQLVGPGVDVTTPRGLSRGFVVSIAPSNGRMEAQARLIVDPSGSHGATVADETLTIGADSTGIYHVLALQTGQLSDQPSGPHVIHAGLGRDPSVVRVAFDSDLDARTVSGAFGITSGPASIPVVVTYDATSRTATLTLLSPAGAGLTLSVAASLRDISGQALAHSYSVTLTS